MPNRLQSRQGIFSAGILPSLRGLARGAASRTPLIKRLGGAAAALAFGLVGSAHASQVTVDNVVTATNSCADAVAAVTAAITVNGANSNRVLVAVLNLADNLNDSSADIGDANVSVSDNVHGAFTRVVENLGSSNYGGNFNCAYFSYPAYRAAEIFVLNPAAGVNAGSHTVSANFTYGNRVHAVRMSVFSLYNVVQGGAATYVTGNAGGTATANVNYSLAIPTAGYLVISGLSCLDGRTLTATSSGSVATIANSFCTNTGCSTASLSGGNFYSPTPPSGAFAVTWTMSASNSRWSSAAIALPPANYAPTNIGLSNSTLLENIAANSTVGTLSTTDPDAGNTFTYSFATGGPDNASFTITGNTLKLTPSPDFETKPSYNITIRTTDQGGLIFDKNFVINITDVNEAPTNILLSSNTISEQQSINTVIGNLSTVDPDAGQSFTYTLGGTDAASFNLSGGQLRSSSIFDFEVKNSYSITITSTDNGAGNLQVTIPFTITILDVSTFTISPLAFSFGGRDVFSGATASQNFLVTNERPITINITGTSLTGADAGDFAITANGGAAAVPSNTSRVISVAFDPNAPKGAKNAVLVVSSNDVVNPALASSLDGISLAPEIGISSPGNFGLQDIDLGQTISQDIVITNTGTSNMTITGVSISGDFVITGDTGETTLAPAAIRTVTVAFDPTVVGARTGALTLAHNGTNTSSPTSVALGGTGTNNQLTIAPSVIDFNTWEIDAGPQGTQTITITNSRATSITITGITLTITLGTTPFTLTGSVAPGVLAPGASRTVNIDFDPSTIGAKAGYVTINSTDVSVPTFQVNLAGVGIDQELGLSPVDHDFGARDIDLGPTLVQTFTFTNIGAAPLTITAATLIGINPTQFSIFAQDITGNEVVAPGDFRTVQVNFDPSTVGLKQATLEIATNDVNHFAGGIADIAIQGTGTNNTINVSAGSHSFGDQDIDDGATTSFPVTITNARSTNLTITSVLLVDGTTGFAIAADSGSNPQTLGPNESRTVSVRFDPSILGAAVDTLRIISNDATYPTFDVSLDGNGTDQQMQLDAFTINLGQRDIDLGASASQSVTVTNVGTAPLTLTSISITLNGADFSILSGGGAGTLAPNETRVVEVQFDPTTIGAKTGTLTIVSDDTNHTATEAITLNGIGTNNQVTVDTGSVPFGTRDIDNGQSASVSVTITNNRSTNVTINSISLVSVSGEDAFILTGATASGVLLPNESRTVVVSFDPSLEGFDANILRFNTTDASSPIIDVALTGTGTDQAIDAQPASIDFGAHDIDLGPVTLNVTITNTGTSDLSISDVILTGAADFSILSGGGTALLAPNDTRIIQLQFNPTVLGTEGAMLEIDSDDVHHSPVVFVGISGSGSNNSISVSPGSHDFGLWDIDAGQTAATTVTITNTRTTSIIITSVSLIVISGTNPFTITSDSGQTTLGAGQSRTLNVVFDPNNVAPASKEALLRVVSNDASFPTVDVDLTGTAIDQQIGADQSALSFGAQDIDLGATAAQTVNITNIGTALLTFTGLEVTITGTDAADFTIDTDTLNPNLGPGATRTVLVSFNPTTIGAKSAMLVITSDDTNHTPTVTIPLSGTATNNQIAVSPGLIGFGSQDIDDGDTVPAQTVTITNARATSLTITSVTLLGTNPADFTKSNDSGQTTLAPGASRTLDLAFNPSATGARTATLRVISNDAATPTVNVALTGTGSDQQIDVQPPSLNLGSRDIDFGATSQQTITITNNGTALLTFTGLGVAITGTDAADFSISSDTGETTLGPGLSRILGISFDPTTIGAKTATLTVTSDDTHHTPSVNVALSGTGTNNKLGFDPANLSFGPQDIAAGATASQIVTFTNNRITTVQILTVGLTGADAGEFGITAVGSTPITIIAGGTANVSVAFNPSTVGSKAATLSVTTNDPSVPTADIALDGAGTNVTPSPTPTLSAASDWNSYE